MPSHLGNPDTKGCRIEEPYEIVGDTSARGVNLVDTIGVGLGNG